MFLEFLSETAVLAAAVTDIDSVVRRLLVFVCFRFYLTCIACDSQTMCDVLVHVFICWWYSKSICDVLVHVFIFICISQVYEAMDDHEKKSFF